MISNDSHDGESMLDIVNSLAIVRPAGSHIETKATNKNKAMPTLMAVSIETFCLRDWRRTYRNDIDIERLLERRPESEVRSQPFHSEVH